VKVIVLTILLAFAGAVSHANAANDARAGKELHQAKCNTCHGPDGQGKASLEKVFDIKMKPLGSAEVQNQTEEQLARDITTGFGMMPPVKIQSDEDVGDLIAFVRTLAKMD